MKSITILGAGNAGCAAAAHLTSMGFHVSMFNRWESELAPIKEKGGIRFKGSLGEGFAQIETATTEIEEAAQNTDLYLVVAPALAHGFFAQELAKVIRESPTRIMLNPGHTGGALHFLNVLRRAGVSADIHICETNTNTYICRLTGSAEVTVYGLARSVLFGAIPGRRTRDLAEMVSTLFPFISPVESVVETGFANVNALMHPAGMLLNAGWIENTGGDFSFYYQGTTPAVGRVIDEVDRERLAVTKALGIDAKSFIEVFYEYGATSQHSLITGSSYDALRESEPNKRIMAPKSLTNRYLAEDIPYGLVPMAAFGDLAGVETPVIDALITMASTANQVDYSAEGLSLESMGLAGLTMSEIKTKLNRGL